MPEHAIPSGFCRIERPDALLVLLDRCRSSLLDFFSVPLDRWQSHPDAVSHAGKARHFSVPLPGGAGRAFVRRWARGGGARWLGRWFTGPGRAFRELEALDRARRAGLGVPEPLAVVVENTAFGCRLTTVTREVSSAGDLPAVLGRFEDAGASDATPLRRTLARRFGAAVGGLHRLGIFPEDLHLRNVLVVRTGNGPDVCLVDLDPVRLMPEAGPGDRTPGLDASVGTLARLLRSCRRWTRAGLRIERTDYARFIAGYAPAAGLDRKQAQELADRIAAAPGASPRDAGRDARGVVVLRDNRAVPSSPARVLFRMPSWLGDAVMAIPLLEGARRAWPKADLAVLTPGKLRDLYALAPVPVEVIPHDGSAGLETVRARGWDIVIAVPRSFGAAWMAVRCGGGIRAGFDGPFRDLLYSRRVRADASSTPRHRVETLWSLGAPFGFGPFPPPPRLVLPGAAREEADRILAAAGIRPDDLLIGINPGAAYGPAKQWPAERFAETAVALAGRPGARLLLFGAGVETPIAESIARAAGSAAVCVAGRTTLALLAALVARCRVFVTNDTGPMHVAAALGVPVVAVFGSTDPDATGPYGPGHRVVRKPAPCAPCLLRRCPIDFRCMRAIPASSVVEEAERAVTGAARVA
jgi:heptosyltransferase II